MAEGTNTAADAANGTTSADRTGNQENANQALVADVTKNVMNAMGIKDGQALPDMIAAAAKISTMRALGVPKDTNPQDHLVGMFKTAAQELLADAKPKDTGTATNGKTAELDAVRAELETVKGIANELTTERDAERERATSEQRAGLIRDALAKHNIRPEAVDMVRTNFVSGNLGINPQRAEDGSLVVDGGNGSPQPFANFLDGYFDANRYLLQSHTARGTGATGRNNGTANTVPDVKGFTDRSNNKQVASAYEADAEGTLKALQASNAQKRKSIYPGA